MRTLLRIALMTLGPLMAAGAAAGQSDNNTGNPIAVPPAPPIVAAPPSADMPPPMVVQPAPPPGLVETPLPPVGADNAPNAVDTTNTDTGGNAASIATPQPAPSTAPPASWVNKTTAVIGVLNKVDGSIADVSIPVGGQSTVGDLQITVLACVVRPPEQVPDAAIFLATQPTGNSAGPPEYRGWMLRSVPGATVVGNASDTFRVVDCQ